MFGAFCAEGLRGQSVASYVGNTPITVSHKKVFRHHADILEVVWMQKAWDLHLVGALLRLAPGDVDTEGAARQWAEIFDVCTSGHLLMFTNARMVLWGGPRKRSRQA